jgi:hypothetical protein
MRQLIFVIVLALSGPALADTPDSPTKVAGEHFDRGVSMYGEADYRAALVEFRRAYEIAPNAAVLYNLGQTYYQLQNYAAALAAFQHYLADAGDSPSHKAEVDDLIKTLKSRVGHVQITTSLPDSEITVDDDLVGKTPLTTAVDVSIGRRKITALHGGRAPETRYVDVSAGETAKLAIEFAQTSGDTGPAKPNDQPAQPIDDSNHATATKALWVATAVLGVGALVTGGIAWKYSRDLSDEKNTFPVAQPELDKTSSRVTTFSAVADITGAVAVVTGALALYFTLSHSKDHEVHAGLTPTGLQIAGTFK